MTTTKEPIKKAKKIEKVEDSELPYEFPKPLTVKEKLTTLYGNLGFEFEVIPGEGRDKLIAKHLCKPQWESIFDPEIAEIYGVVNEYAMMTLYKVLSNAKNA